jgi:hypothetical protein
MGRRMPKFAALRFAHHGSRGSRVPKNRCGRARSGSGSTPDRGYRPLKVGDPGRPAARTGGLCRVQRAGLWGGLSGELDSAGRFILGMDLNQDAFERSDQGEPPGIPERGHYSGSVKAGTRSSDRVNSMERNRQLAGNPGHMVNLVPTRILEISRREPAGWSARRFRALEPGRVSSS